MLDDFLTSKAASFKDGVHTELRAQENRSRRVVLLDGNLITNSRSESRGVSARVTANGSSGFSSKAECSAAAADLVLAAATKNASFLGDRRKTPGKGFPALAKETVALNDTITDTEQKDYIDFVKEIDSYSEKNFKNLVSRRLVLYTDSTEKRIVTSDAASGHVVIPRHYIYSFFSANTPDGNPVELMKVFGGYGNFTQALSKPSDCFAGLDELYEKLMQKREGIYPEAGLKTVVLGSSLAGMLAHEAVGHTVEADIVLGGSVAGHNLNKQVASPLVNMTDFARVPYAGVEQLPVYLDDEGTVPRDAELIKDGILVGYMHNRASAEHFGVAPTGNARAWEFSDEPLIRMRNTLILPGQDKFEDIIASIDDGYYLIDTNNGQADMTGEFMFGVCMGYEIKKGKLGRALLDHTISGVAFDMLKSVDMISDKVKCESSGFCGKKQPMPVGLGGPEVKCKIMIGGK